VAYSGPKIIASFVDLRSRQVGGTGRPQDDSTEGERTQSFPFILYDVKHVQAAEVSQQRTAVSSKCFQLYYTGSDRLDNRAPPCCFHIFPLLL
jgi:hypothetical protein